ncbi:hypothetical protein VTN02DRAFT_4424 [Thermoascus thermophilus]
MASTPSDGPAGGEAPGGFIQPSLPSPAPSSTWSASTATPSILPRQRTHPLRPGSMKETTLINHIDKSILKVNRRHAKKFGSRLGTQDEAEAATERGYESFKEVVKDIENIVDVVWVSGTPSLQIPYLISLAVLVNSYLPDYPFTPRSTFRLIKKLDAIFASLLTGEDVETGAPLSGFEGRRQVVSMTEKVRIKSIAEMCRVAVVEARDREDSKVTEEEDDEMDTDSAAEDDSGDVYGTDEYAEPAGRWEMEAARVYERTIQLLGDELGKQGGL